MDDRKLRHSDDALLGVRAVVTGSTRGFGEAIARDLVARGARVVINGTDASRCAALAEEMGAIAVPGSVALEHVVDELVSRCVAEFGGIDLLVNNAGISRDGLLTKAAVDDFDAVVGVHLRGTWLASRAAARAMRHSGGSIVNIVSGTALYGNVGQSAYAAAKGGILALTRALSLELRRSGIRVNAITPVVRTEMVQPLLRLDPELESMFGAPADVARVVSYLASPGADRLTGLVLGFNGAELSLWTHPSARVQVRRTSGWRFADFAEVVESVSGVTPNPDTFGQAVHTRLGVGPSVDQPPR